MIYIRVELWPGGDPEKKKILGEGAISNNGDLSEKTGGLLGKYVAVLSKSGGFRRDTSTIRADDIWKKGEVGPFKRKAGGAWDLLRLTLDTLLDGRDFQVSDSVPSNMVRIRRKREK